MSSLVIALLCSGSLCSVGGCKTKDEAKTASGTGTSPSTSASDKPAASASLLDPAAAKETAPATFKAKFNTTKGDFVLEIHRDWAPNGADRFYNLVKIGYYNDLAFFRVIKGFMVQFGINGVPQVNQVWRQARIPDDAAGVHSNARGMVTFATAGPNTRTTQLFINYGNNANLDGMGFAPIGQVVEGMDVVDNIEGEYGEGAPGGRGPAQGQLQMEGNSYLKANFPRLDYIKKVSIQ